MKEWLISNTNITEEMYDNIINCDKDFNNSGIDYNYIFSHPNAYIMNDIMHFTLDQRYKKRQFIKFGYYYFYKGNREISFSLLSDFFPNEKENLLSENRYGKCHTVSYNIALNSSFDIITMICSDIQSGKDFLHTVLYTENSDEILDYTLNLIMDRKQYAKLMNARVVKIIDNARIKEIYANIKSSDRLIYQKTNIKELLCFPDEINNLALKMKI